MSSEEHELGPAGAVLDATRLLRCRATGQYWSHDGWKPTIEGAAKFSDEIDAARACVTHDLHDVDLVLRSAAGTEIFSTALR
jgi:hypothetical protein